MSLQASKSGPRSPAEPKDLLQNETPYNQRDNPPPKEALLTLHPFIIFPRKGADVTGFAPPAPPARRRPRLSDGDKLFCFTALVLLYCSGGRRETSIQRVTDLEKILTCQLHAPLSPFSPGAKMQRQLCFMCSRISPSYLLVIPQPLPWAQG